ncbi:MAG TPA: alcohol dehydrogenase catalytic domain-containing protein, partial [Verrucomicrobiae bacterium]
MKAIGYQKSLPAADSLALQDITRPEPVPGPHDLVVEIRAISVNPVDTKVRRNTAPAEGEWKILGWDAAGIVRATGSAVTLFKPGDRVWYAGDLSRPGTNAELHLVDERIVGPMPACLDFAAAAALPLTSITAWELLFDRLQIPRGGPASERSLLIIGAAGGVGSIMVQLA